MATAEQRARRRAQRETAKAVREARQKGGRYQPRLPKQIRQRVRQAQIDYGKRVLSGEEPEPAYRSKEGDQLARLAAWAQPKVGKADPEFRAFEKYFYKHKK